MGNNVDPNHWEPIKNNLIHQIKITAFPPNHIEFLCLETNENFKMKRKLFLERYYKGLPVSPGALPIRKTGDNLSLVKNEYDIIKIVDPHYTLKHKKCNQEFTIQSSTMSGRIKSGSAICIQCNPLITRVEVQNRLTNDYQLISKRKENYKLLHIACGNEFEIHRRTASLRLDNNHELCMVCNHIKRQDSYMELEIAKFCESLTDEAILYGKDRYRRGLFTMDIFYPEWNLAIEFNGDYNHANPKYYKPTDVIRNKTAKQIWERGKRKKKKFADITIYEIWENEWNDDKENTKSKIRKILESHIGSSNIKKLA